MHTQAHTLTCSIRCVRCKTISLCLCWCYLQMNTVLCCSEHNLAHPEVRLFLTAVWHTTCHTSFIHPPPPLQLCLIYLSHYFIPSPSTQCSPLSPFHPCIALTLHFHTFVLPFFPPLPILFISLSTHPTPTSPFDFLLLHLNHTSFLLPPQLPASLSPALCSLWDKSSVLLRCTDIGAWTFLLMGALSLNREAFAYLIREQREGLLGLRGLLCDYCLSDWKTAESGPHSPKLLLSYLIMASQNRGTFRKCMNIDLSRSFWKITFLSWFCKKILQIFDWIASSHIHFAQFYYEMRQDMPHETERGAYRN